MTAKNRAGVMLAAMAAAAMVLTGCSSTENSSKVVATTGGAAADAGGSDAPVDNPIGSTQEIVDDSTTTRVTVETLEPAQAAQYGMPAKGELWQVTTTLQGVEGTTNVNPLYFTARAADGTSYPAALGATDGQLQTGTVAAGDVIKGLVAFDVTGGPIASIRYNGALMDELASWKVTSPVPAKSDQSAAVETAPPAVVNEPPAQVATIPPQPAEDAPAVDEAVEPQAPIGYTGAPIGEPAPWWGRSSITA